MTCDEIERDDIAEQYVLGRLDDEASAAFEAHYFECSRCLERVGELEAAQSALTAAAARSATVVPRRRLLWPVAGGLAAAAVLVLAINVTRESSAPPSTRQTPSAATPDAAASPPSRSLDLERLGAIEPPRFTPPRLRSGASDSRRTFTAAMAAYTRGDYAGAIPGLEEAAKADSAFPAARFFLGVSYLQLDRRTAAIEHLREVTRGGESPYLEDAHFFVAKALIRNGDLNGARGELRTVLALEGDRRGEAARLLAEIESAGDQRPQS